MTHDLDARLAMTQPERFAKFDEHRDGWHAGQPDALCHECDYNDLPAWGTANDRAALRADLEARNAVERDLLAGADWGHLLHMA